MKFSLRGKGERKKAGGTNDRVRQPRLMEGQDSYTFRRSRTITGSLSNNVNTPRSERPDLKSERLKLHELHQHKRMLKTGISGLVLVSLLLAGLLMNSVTFAHKRFVASGQVPTNEQQAVIATINNYSNRHPLEAFLFTLNETTLQQFIQAAHPEIESVTVVNGWLGGTGGITLEFREPVIVWKVSDSKFYVDEDGTSFTKLYGSEPVLKVQDTSGFTPDAAAQGSIASTRFIGYLGQLLGALNALKIGSVERVIIPAPTRQLDIRLKGREYPIKTHTDRDPYAQAEDIKNALRFLDSRRITPEYLDVRVEGKAFYK